MVGSIDDPTVGNGWTRPFGRSAVDDAAIDCVA
jgi:hypothetical protein